MATVNAQEQPQTDTTQAIPSDSVTAPSVETNITEEPEPKKERKFLQKPEKRLHVGGRAGVSMGNFSSNPSGYSTSANIGFNAGIYFRVFIFTRLYIQPEVLYYFSSYDFKRSIDGKSDDVKIHSMEIPLLVGLTAIDKPKFRLGIQTGPSFGFHLKVKDNDVGVTKNDFNSTYVSWVSNAQMRIGKVTVMGGYRAGMTKYYGNARNHSWYAGLGFSM